MFWAPITAPAQDPPATLALSFSLPVLCGFVTQNLQACCPLATALFFSLFPWLHPPHPSSSLCFSVTSSEKHPSVVSDSVRPQRRQPTSLPHPWDSPGKNTGVGCHFLPQCMKVKVKPLSRVRPSATPWTAAFQAPPSIGFSRQEYWSGVPLPSPVAMR